MHSRARAQTETAAKAKKNNLRSAGIADSSDGQASASGSSEVVEAQGAAENDGDDDEAAIGKNSNKWAGGKPLVAVWRFERRGFWWDTIDPYALPRSKRLSQHFKGWRSAVLARATIKARWRGRNPAMRAAMVTVLLNLQVR